MVSFQRSTSIQNTTLGRKEVTHFIVSFYCLGNVFIYQCNTTLGTYLESFLFYKCTRVMVNILEHIFVLFIFLIHRKTYSFFHDIFTFLSVKYCSYVFSNHVNITYLIKVAYQITYFKNASIVMVTDKISKYSISVF